MARDGEAATYKQKIQARRFGDNYEGSETWASSRSTVASRWSESGSKTPSH